MAPIMLVYAYMGFTLSYGFVGKRWLVPLNLKMGFYIKFWKLCFGSVFLSLEKDWIAFSIIKGKSLPNKIWCPSLALFTFWEVGHA